MGPQCQGNKLADEGNYIVCNADNAEKPAPTCVAAPETEKLRAVAPRSHPQRPSLLDRRRSSLKRPSIVIQSTSFANDANQPLKGYVLAECLGSGSMGRVQRAVRISDEKQVALKMTWCRDEEKREAAQREFRSLLSIRHPNVIRALDLHDNGDQVVLAMDYFAGAPLDASVQFHPKEFSEKCSRRYARQLFGALDHVHGRGLVHRDIKPANILVGLSAMKLMLIDFNTACALDADSNSLMPAGTQLYMAPEELQASTSSQRSDVWSAALCVFLMLSGRLPQRRDRGQRSVKEFALASTKPVTVEGKELQHVSSACKSFLLLCLAIDESARPTAALALNTEWFYSFAEEYNIYSPMPVGTPNEGSMVNEKGGIIQDDDDIYLQSNSNHVFRHVRESEPFPSRNTLRRSVGYQQHAT